MAFCYDFIIQGGEKMKKRISAFVVTFVLALSIFASTVSASTCPIRVEGKPCGCTVSSSFQGNAGPYKGTHKYGGILGIGQKTCNYTYYYSCYANKCSKGHTLGTNQVRWETGHEC